MIHVAVVCRATALLAVALAIGAPRPARAALSSGERSVLRAYLDALVAGRYAAAFALLDAGERRYFGSPRNYASIYAADELRVQRYRVLGADAAAPGAVALVSERVTFRDFARDATASADVRVSYGIVLAASGPAIHDPAHPWRAATPIDARATDERVDAAIRKVSFFAGRTEFVVTFENRGPRTVTLLPYGRSILKDENGKVFRPIAARSPSLTDANLYEGVRLPSSGRYTGFVTFATAGRFAPSRLRLTLAPALFDGAASPFELTFGDVRLK